MNILFIGPPGSGKGTQSKLLHEKHHLVHLSTGDMFREAISKQTEVGVKAKGFMDRGEYVPDAVVIELIQERLRQPDCSKSGFILDGFPRTEPQARALELLLESLKMKLDAIFYFDIQNEVLVKRLSSRRTCRNCNQVVSEDQQAQAICKKSADGKCDFYQRTDDAPDVVRKRIEIYQAQTAPIIGYYSSKKEFLKLDGSEPPQTVFARISAALKV